MRLIDAELAVRHIEELTEEKERSQSNFSANWIIAFLEAFPEAEPIKAGYWIDENLVCSVAEKAASLVRLAILRDMKCTTSVAGTKIIGKKENEK